MESLIDDNVAAILVNNPNNPCGSVYSRQHLLDLLRVAEKHHCPIISDDVYQEMASVNNVYTCRACLQLTLSQDCCSDSYVLNLPEGY